MILILIAIGLLAGVLAGLFGIGGGILIVPALILLMKLPATTATGTSLAALLLPVGALGAYEYWRHGHVDIRAALIIAAGLFFGAWVGARMAIQIHPFVLRRMFAVFLAVVAVRLWIRA